MRLSVAIPVYNEGAVLPVLISRIREVLKGIEGGPHQVVFVDDGSADGSLETLRGAVADDSRITVIALSRNFGHQAALTAALENVTGEVVVVMDADLQDAPEAIPVLIQKYQQGFDVVYAIRTRRKEPLPLRICFFLFYRLLSRLSDLRLPLDAGDFGLMSSRVVEQIRQMPEHQRYLRGLRAWVGFRQIGVEVERQQRLVGNSKYSWSKLLKLAFDGIFAFSTVPIRVAIITGLLMVVLSFCFSFYAIFERFFSTSSPKGFTATTVLITFLGGLQLLFFGIVGEYVGRIYEEVKRRPHYVVKEIIAHSGIGSESYRRSDARVVS